jgi:DNA-binding CsgD family transcriptional regulator
MAVAESLVVEADVAAEVTDSLAPAYGRLAITAWKGHPAELSRLIDQFSGDMAQREEGKWDTACLAAAAILNNGLGNYEGALVAAEACCDGGNELSGATHALAEVVEAAARTGQMDRGAAALVRLSELTGPSHTGWARGLEARSRALLAEGDAAEPLYQMAIDHLGGTRMRTDLGRAHLVYGEWLRRQKRRVDARHQLRLAYEMFSEMGMRGFAERALRELRATGETVRQRRDDTRSDLTPQEEQIARLALEGRTNPEIGAQLYLSARTVEWHLRKVFTKLGIASRRELRDALPAGPASSKRY